MRDVGLGRKGAARRGSSPQGRRATWVLAARALRDVGLHRTGEAYAAHDYATRDHAAHDYATRVYVAHDYATRRTGAARDCATHDYATRRMRTTLDNATTPHGRDAKWVFAARARRDVGLRRSGA